MIASKTKLWSSKLTLLRFHSDRFCVIRGSAVQKTNGMLSKSRKSVNIFLAKRQLWHRKTSFFAAISLNFEEKFRRMTGTGRISEIDLFRRGVMIAFGLFASHVMCHTNLLKACQFNFVCGGNFRKASAFFANHKSTKYHNSLCSYVVPIQEVVQGVA